MEALTLVLTVSYIVGAIWVIKTEKKRQKEGRQTLTLAEIYALFLIAGAAFLFILGALSFLRFLTAVMFGV